MRRPLCTGLGGGAKASEVQAAMRSLEDEGDAAAAAAAEAETADELAEFSAEPGSPRRTDDGARDDASHQDTPSRCARHVWSALVLVKVCAFVELHVRIEGWGCLAGFWGYCPARAVHHEPHTTGCSKYLAVDRGMGARNLRPSAHLQHIPAQDPGMGPPVCCRVSHHTVLQSGRSLGVAAVQCLQHAP